MAPPRNAWVRWLMAIGSPLLTFGLLQLGLSPLKTVAVILSVFVASVPVMIVVSPGPKTKEFVERLKNHFRPSGAESQNKQ